MRARLPKRRRRSTLGDGTRRAILERLAERPRAVGELADEPVDDERTMVGQSVW